MHLNHAWPSVPSTQDNIGNSGIAVFWSRARFLPSTVNPPSRYSGTTLCHKYICYIRITGSQPSAKLPPSTVRIRASVAWDTDKPCVCTPGLLNSMAITHKLAILENRAWVFAEWPRFWRFETVFAAGCNILMQGIRGWIFDCTAFLTQLQPQALHPQTLNGYRPP